MSLLRIYVHSFLTEAAMSVDNLQSKDAYISVRDYSDRALIYYSDSSGNSFDASIKGKIEIGDPQKEECDGAWEVKGSEVDSGWGPLLYDVAIEWATMNANGLVSDRDSVSHEAKNIWQHYYHNRSDVQSHSVDLDQCEFPDESHPDMAKNPHDDKYIGMSMRYTKEPRTMMKLMQIKRYVKP
jgi:hypothetical protein